MLCKAVTTSGMLLLLVYCLTDIVGSVRLGPSITLRHGSLLRVVRRVIAIVIFAVYWVCVGSFGADGGQAQGGGSGRILAKLQTGDWRTWNHMEPSQVGDA